MTLVALVMATILARRNGPLDPQVMVGLGALAGTGLVARRQLAAGAGTAVIGAWLVVSGADATGGAPMHVAAVGAVVVIGAGIADLDRRWSPERRSPSPASALVAGWACAVALSVPDTEQAIPVAGVLAATGAASLAAAFVGWPGASRVGALAWWPVAGLLVWVALIGGIGRDGSVAGALAGAGALIAEPLAFRLVNRSSTVRASARSAAIVLVLHAEATFIAARVASRPDDLGPATVMGVIVVAALTAVLAAVAPWESADPHDARTGVGSGP